MAVDFVTPDQVKAARAVDLVGYLHRSEPGNIVRSTPDEYRLKDHDSLKISNGKFHWFSRGIGGTNAVDYLVKVRGLEFKEAVRELAGLDVSITDPSVNRDGSPPPITNPRKPSARTNRADDGHVFALPPPDSHNDDIIGYLKGRGIPENIILSCIEEKTLYQSADKHCVFVGYDGGAAPRFAHERGIKRDFKKDAFGSDKAFGFRMPPINKGSHVQDKSTRLYVFEGAIDCLSHAAIARLGNADWDGYRLALGGVSNLALNAFLENNTGINKVYLCLDNDIRGKEAAERIGNELISDDAHGHIGIYIAPPPDGIGKDFNDTLMFMMERIKEKRAHIGNAPVLGADTPNPAQEPKPATDRKRYETVL